MPELSDHPWRFDAAPSDAGSDALRGHILPHGAGEDDPCVAWVEGVGSADLAVMLAGPELLAALEALVEVASDIAAEQCADGENVAYWNRTSGSGWQAVTNARAAIAKTKGA